MGHPYWTPDQDMRSNCCWALSAGEIVDGDAICSKCGEHATFEKEEVEKPKTKDVARFFDKVKITKHCWLWIASKNKKGYGGFDFKGKQILAHRFSYELFVGAIEPGKQILHRRECGNPSCVNPNHLYMGTHTDNVRDMIIWGNVAMGTRSGRAKLTEEDVLSIRRIHEDKQLTYKNTANLFGITAFHVGQIVLRHYWKHLPDC